MRTAGGGLAAATRRCGGDAGRRALGLDGLRRRLGCASDGRPGVRRRRLLGGCGCRLDSPRRGRQGRARRRQRRAARRPTARRAKRPPRGPPPVGPAPGWSPISRSSAFASLFVSTRAAATRCGVASRSAGGVATARGATPGSPHDRQASPSKGTAAAAVAKPARPAIQARRRGRACGGGGLAAAQPSTSLGSIAITSPLSTKRSGLERQGERQRDPGDRRRRIVVRGEAALAEQPAALQRIGELGIAQLVVGHGDQLGMRPHRRQLGIVGLEQAAHQRPRLRRGAPPSSRRRRPARARADSGAASPRG